MDSFTKESVSIASARFFPDNLLGSSTIFLARATQAGGAMGIWNLGKILLIIVPKSYTGKISFFWHKTVKLVRINLSVTRPLLFFYGYCGSHGTAYLRETQSHRIFYRSQSVSKSRASPRKQRIVSCILVHFWITVSEQSWQWAWTITEKKKIPQASVCVWHCRPPFCHDLHRLDQV